jgi:hypothetical protein
MRASEAWVIEPISSLSATRPWMAIITGAVTPVRSIEFRRDQAEKRCGLPLHGNWREPVGNDEDDVERSTNFCH